MQHLFIGLDVHKSSWSVTIQQGSVVLKRFSMQACSATLIHYISKHYPGYSVECCYECCCVGYHIYRDLSAVGWKVLVVNPGDIPRTGKQSSSKTDKIDSRHLSVTNSPQATSGAYMCRMKSRSSSEAFFAADPTW